MDIVDFEAVPWGNAYMNISDCQGSATPGLPPGAWDRGVIRCWIDLCSGDKPPESCWMGDAPQAVCQHGATECAFNLMEACAVETLDSQADQVNFVICMENKAEGSERDAEAAAKACATQVGVSADGVLACYGSADGVKAQRDMAQRTVALGSSRPGTPWVVVDGQALQDVSALLQAVCDAYTGAKPAGCSPAASKASNMCTIDAPSA